MRIFKEIKGFLLFLVELLFLEKIRIGVEMWRHYYVLFIRSAQVNREH